MFSQGRISVTIVSLALTLISPLAMTDHPSLSLETGVAGAIHTSSAVPLPASKSVISLKVEHIKNDAFSTAELETFADNQSEVHGTDSLQTTTLTGGYGLNDDLTIGFSLPYIDRQNLMEASHHHDEHEVERLGDAKGLGDLTLYGQYRLFENDVSNRHFAIIFGIKAPTGKTSRHTIDGETFEAEHQPGSGSWDGLVGFAYTQQTGGLTLNVSTLYSRAREGTQKTDQGDALSYNAALSYRLGNNEHGHPSDGHQHGHSAIESYDLVLELNGDWRDKTEIDGKTSNNTGGNLVYLSPGVRLQLDDRWSATASLKLPVLKSLNGDQSNPKWLFNVGASRAF